MCTFKQSTAFSRAFKALGMLILVNAEVDWFQILYKAVKRTLLINLKNHSLCYPFIRRMCEINIVVFLDDTMWSGALLPVFWNSVVPPSSFFRSEG